MDRALALAEAGDFAQRRRGAAESGKLLGLGVANAIERAAPPGLEFAEIRFAPSGGVTVLCGATTQGQGHATTFAQLLSDRLGLEPEEIRFVQGDTDRLAFGFGAGGSRISAMGCAALLIAADKVIAKAKKNRGPYARSRRGRHRIPRRPLRHRRNRPRYRFRRRCQGGFPAGAPPGRPRAGPYRDGNIPFAGRELSQRVPTSARSKSTGRPAEPESSATSWSTISAP